MAGRRLLRDEGEHAWIARLARRLDARAHARVVLGIGDDAAVVRWGRRPLVVTTDTQMEGVHFRLDWLSPAALGQRLVRVNVSDVAAMGGTPVVAVLALEAPGRVPVAVLDRVVDAAARELRARGAALVGGNVSAGARLAFTLTLLGEAPGRVATRAGARAGDHLFVTGRLGAAGTAVRKRRRGQRVRWPAVPVRIEAGLALAGVAHAMIDVSDGLVQDLGHVCRASGVAAEVELARLPVDPGCRRALGATAAMFAATAGEDYELLVAVPPRRLPALARLRARLQCPLTEVGRVVAGAPAVVLRDAAGRRVPAPRRGFDHFR